MRRFSFAIGTTALLILSGARAQTAPESETVFVRAGALPGAVLDPSTLPMKTEVLTPQDIARLRGDESNLNAKTDGYAVFSASGACRVSGAIEMFVTVENLFDEEYETFGTFSPTDSVPLSEAPGATNPRILSPAPPVSIFAGVRARAFESIPPPPASVARSAIAA